MSDMLVKLYELQDISDLVNELVQDGITIRAALAPELHIVKDWVNQNFSKYWESEVVKAFSNNPITCYLAIKNGEILGFSCVNATLCGFFGPMGVSEKIRGKKIGKALLVYGLQQLKYLGFGYAIIGGVGPKEFYSKHVGAVEIENSTPGVYKGLLKIDS